MKTVRSRLLKTGLWMIPVAVIAIAILFRGFAENEKSPPPPLRPVPVKVIQPKQGDLVRNLKLNAHVESENMVTIVPLVSGILQEVFVDVGTYVKKDTIIARIDSARYQLQLQQAEAAYFSAKSTYERVAQLYAAGATPQQNYDQAKGQFDAYASQYELAQLQLNYANVKSPVSGVVLVRHLSPGSIAAPERPLVTIGDLDSLIVRAQIPEKYYEQFRSKSSGNSISIVSSSGRRFPATIKTISPFVSADTKNFELTVSIADSEKVLRPGMFVSIEIELASWKSVSFLPYEVLSGADTLWTVKDGIANRHTIGPITGSDEFFIIPPELAQATFIVEGQYFLKENSPVTIVAEDLAQ